jgi:hypothetical protein
LANHLREIASKPAKYLHDNDIRSVLKRQGRLAQFSAPGIGIHAMSLNHMRAMAGLLAELGGFAKLDALRRQALEVLDQESVRSSRGDRRNKAGLIAKISSLEAEVSVLKRDLTLLQRAYDLRCLQARHYASAASAAVVGLCAKEQKEIDASFSLRRAPLPTEEVKVVDIGERRARAKAT